MQTTPYFRNKVLKHRPYLQGREDWLKKAWEKPIHVEKQENGRVRHFIYIEELDKYLRVVFEGEVVHNAFLDRGFAKNRH